MKIKNIFLIIAIFLALLIFSSFGNAIYVNSTEIIENYTNYNNVDSGRNLTGLFTLVGNVMCSGKRIGGCSMQSPILQQSDEDDTGALNITAGGSWNTPGGTNAECIKVNATEYLWGNSSIKSVANCDTLNPNEPYRTLNRTQPAVIDFWMQVPAIATSHLFGLGSANSNSIVRFGTHSGLSTNFWMMIDGTGNDPSNMSVMINQWVEVQIVMNGTGGTDYYMWNGNGTSNVLAQGRAGGTTPINRLNGAGSLTGGGAFYDGIKAFNTSRNPDNVNSSAYRIPYRIVNLSAVILWVIGLALVITLGIQVADQFSADSTSRQEFILTKTKCDTLFLRMREVNDWNGKGKFRRKHSHISFRHRLFSTDSANIYFGYPTLDIVKSESDSMEIVVYNEAMGKDKKEALHYAHNINYQIFQTDSLVELMPYFSISKDEKWRNQQVHIEVRMPKGKTVYLAKNMSDILDDVHNETDTYDGDMVGRRWIMGTEELRCIDCNGLDIEHGKKWKNKTHPYTLQIQFIP